MNQANTYDPQARRVRVVLAARTRHEWSAVVEVPVNTSETELAELVDQFFHAIGMEDYTLDDEYWQKGDCRVVADDDADAYATYRAVRDPQGKLLIETTGNTLWCIVHGEAFAPTLFPSRLAAEVFQVQCGDDYVSGPWEIQVS